jgi:mRNA interferase YafQ
VRVAVRSGQFPRDVKRAQKAWQGHEQAARADTAAAGDGLPEWYKDHPLKGNWKGYRDAHIEPDWLLIYRVAGDELHLVRTGSHADLFDE